MVLTLERCWKASAINELCVPLGKQEYTQEQTEHFLRNPRALRNMPREVVSRKRSLNIREHFDRHDRHRHLLWVKTYARRMEYDNFM